LLVFLYVVLNIIFCSVPYKSQWPTTNSVWFADTKAEITTYVANRTGVLSFANMALSVLFAGRNNPLLYITGISQTTALNFHRWSARVATVQAVVHSILYTVTYFWQGGAAAYYEIAAVDFYWWGIIATLALFLLTACSVLPLRQKFYEIFLVTHIALAILAIVGCWYHISLRFATKWGYEVWLYIAIAFWLFDRFARFVRVVAYNWVGGSTEAYAELKAGGLISLKVYPCRSWTVQPGEHTFLYFPGIGRMWESHPFSITNWTENGNQISHAAKESATQLSATDIEKEPTAVVQPLGETSPQGKRQHGLNNQRPYIEFLIRPAKGATKTLHDYLSRFPRTPQPIDVITEGPYGHATTLQHADRVLCIGGGVGITALTGYVQQYTTARRCGKPAASRLLLAWTAREPGLVGVVQDMIPKDAGDHGVQLMLDCTAEGNRLNIADLVATEAAGTQRLAVVVCGPASMADEVRRQVVANLGKGAKIDLHVESFTW
jgi:predicted ferric reductase